MDTIAGPKTNEYPSACRAYDNLIHDIGTIEKQVAGVEISMAMFITVCHNSIYNTPRAGINIGVGCWGGDTIEYNDVFNTVLETGDHGALENNMLINNSFHPHVWLNNSRDIFRYNLVTADYAPIMLDHFGKEVDCNFFSQAASLEAAHKWIRRP